MNSMFKEGLSVVIPIYNEKDNIQLLFKKIINFKENSDINFEFILVDGFSQDGTQELIKESIELNSLHQYVKLYSMKTRNGYGYDIMFGFNIRSQPLCYCGIRLFRMLLGGLMVVSAQGAHAVNEHNRTTCR